MTISMRIIVVISCLVCMHCIYSMEGGKQEGAGAIKVYALTGFGGYKKEEQKMQYEYAQMLFQGDKTNVTITPIVTPLEHCDLGQEHTMNYISNAIEQDQAKDADENKQYDGTVILASSQGAAAIIKLMSEKKLKVPNLRGIFVEGLYLSGNDAFYHSVHGDRPEEYEMLRGLPYVRWWVPHLAQLIKLPHYSPGGAQPIHAVRDIPNEVPIAIIHGKKDQRVEFDHAMALYTQLQQQGKDNVYVISKEAGPDTIKNKRDHVNVLDQQDVPTVQAILHKILPSTENIAKNDERVLSALQPKLTAAEIERYTKLYGDIYDRHKIYERIDRGVHAAKITAGAAAVYVAASLLARNRASIIAAAANLSLLHAEVPELLVSISMALGEYLG